MNSNINLTVTADRTLAWFRGESMRYIVATITADTTSTTTDTTSPINLAIVIDASGSMSGEKLLRAKQAAIGVAELMRDKDHLTVVSFASDVIVHMDKAAMNTRNRLGAVSAINALETRGTTNLSEGWLTAAECLAAITEDQLVSRIILLSDGMANAGVRDPSELARIAAGLAARGISTSTVGIGDDYDISILKAIAENGGGRLHDAEVASEIVDALIGEFGEIAEIAVQNTTLMLTVPTNVVASLVGSSPTTHSAGAISVFMGSLLGGRPRSVIFRVKMTVGAVGETVAFGVSVQGKEPSGNGIEVEPREVLFTLVEGARNNRQVRDEVTSTLVARAWHAEIVHAAANMNRSGERRQVRHYLERELHHFGRYVEGLPEAAVMMQELALIKRMAERSWDERTRKAMQYSSFRLERNSVDHRNREHSESWSARLSEIETSPAQEQTEFEVSTSIQTDAEPHHDA